MAGAGPLIDIGLPVYNGEDFLEATLASILDQTHGDFRLIISDNASTDRTREICLDHAGSDPRIRYGRLERNLGAAPNYNRTYELSSAEYFKWAPHDDVLAPRFLGRCLEALEADRQAVLCQSLIEFIDGEGGSLGVHDPHLGGCEAPETHRRFRTAVLAPHACTHFFGLIRRSALAGTLLHGNFHGADRALVAELALKGRLLQLPEPLLQMREHPRRYTRAALRPRDRQAWHDASRAHRRHFPTWRLYGEYWSILRRAYLPRSSRLRCGITLLAWWGVNWNCARMAVDLLAAFLPGIVGPAQRFKQRHFRPEPAQRHLTPRSTAEESEGPSAE
jgi:glycosyltransferase involved in cell wall biosynthesis